MKKLNIKEFKIYISELKEIITIKKILCFITAFWSIFCLGYPIAISSAYAYEAYFQKQLWEAESKGDCRIINTKIAYDNNYFLVTDKLIKNGKDSYHIYAVDDNNLVHDNSNLKSEIVNYDEFKKRVNFNDTILLAKFDNGILTHIKIYDYYNINAYYSYLNTIIHYYIYKTIGVKNAHN